MAGKKQRITRVCLIIGAAGVTMLAFWGWIYLTGRTYQENERERTKTEGKDSMEEGEQVVNPRPATEPESQVPEPDSEPESEASDTAGYPYVARLQEEKIGIFDAGDHLVYEISIKPGMLTEADRQQLQKGIVIRGEQDLIRLLESFAE